jgi:serine/threonine-protein kinase HipA
MDGYEHYIIKFDIANDDGGSSDFTKLEYLYMRMAKEIGIDIPKIELLHHDNLSHYLIKRFDRLDGKPLHLHSVAGLVHANFNLPMHYSYDELLRVTRYLTHSQSEVEECYKRMVFNIIGRNQDDHAKNFAFLMDEKGKWSLAPAYDITYANGSGYTKTHQLSLVGKVDNFTRDDLLEIASLHSISKNRARQIIDDIKDRFTIFKKRALELEIERGFVDEIDNALRLDI